MAQFELYGKMADAKVCDTCQNGRYLVQREAEKEIYLDVIDKLRITSNDSFIDIGCGSGVNLEPISALVKEAAGCDHPRVIQRLQEKKLQNITWYPGDFLDLEFARTFTKILIYNVVPALPSKKIVYSFIEKALTLLDPAGRMLVGDIANIDKKARFLNSLRGKEFQREWIKTFAEGGGEGEVALLRTAGKSVITNDDFVIGLVNHIRMKGFHAYLVDQPQHLPFGNTREDIVVVGPDYSDVIPLHRE